MTASSVGIYKSIALHLGVAAVLLISVSFSPSPLPTMATNAPVIEATFIDAQAIADTKREQAQAEAQAREVEAQRKKKEAQAAAAKRKRAAEAKQAREKKQAEEAEFKRQKELEQLAAQKEQERKEREAKAKADAERKKKEAAENAEMERIMQEQLAQEQAAQQQRRRAQVLTEVERYTALIQQTIKRNLYDDDSFKGKVCRLNIKLATTGYVTSIRILGGHDALCRAAESAVRRAEELPVSDAADVYEQLKDINLKVEL
ncbi:MULTISPECIES: cell envelope integrity protein TolA [Alteromonas]|jgi:colicin import membrane protein|uniref:Cell envelope integrity protein TolA n=1 Tax=Alteromonas stellipolaris TaxID=233316 RepID=A0AAW7Z7L3_9ALTE|nr:cell envelope integrity protein TolA [Alteromonas stellipolaris]AMJ94410.1 protein TolA [Alteromonas stellipolaris]ANB26611.1 protein TolA [Alteromonas stellipolaris]MDO6579657.1 cell envelope integrity protein TolA [Alteromonas stellipolaris]MDP2536915.1 cell envelope integrity protein TolA [Alteromonas stellipolaris]